MSQSRVDRRIKKVECDRLSVVIEDELKDYYDSTNNIYEDALMDIGVSNDDPLTDDPLTDDPLFENDIEITDNERELHSESDFDINDEESSENYDFSSDEEFLNCEDEMEEDTNDGDGHH